MKKHIAFFDFDGTITTKDSLLEIIKYSKGITSFYLGFLMNLPYMIAYKLRFISNQTAKEKVLQHFFGGMTVDSFNSICENFTTEHLPSIIRPKALKEIIKLKDKGVEVVIVSASPENWIRPWANSIGAQLIATRLTTQDERLTGKIHEKNCHGAKKVLRIKEKYELTDYEKVYAYGDTKADLSMLCLADVQFYKPFR